MQHSSTTLRAIALAMSAAAILGVAACSGDSTGLAGGGSSQIGFMATTQANLSVVPETIGGHTLDISAVSIGISRAELKRAQSDSCPGDNDEDDDHPHHWGNTASCGELKVGPTTIDLPLTGDVATLPANSIPSGTFRELELRLSQVVVKGTFDGKAFDDTIRVRTKGEIEFATPLVVTADSAVKITISVPVNDWFKNLDGSAIDPTTLATNPLNILKLKFRIFATFRAFEDNNHDGREDHDHGRH